MEPEIANAKPKPEQTWQSLTSTNAWGQASELLASGLSMQQARAPARCPTAISPPAQLKTA